MSRGDAINKNKIAFHLCSVITTHPPAYSLTLNHAVPGLTR